MKRLILATIVILCVACVALAATGVLTFRNTNNETGVTLDKKELKDKTQEAVKKTEDAGSKVLEKTGDALHKAAEGLRGSHAAPNAPATTPQPTDKN